MVKKAVKMTKLEEETRRQQIQRGIKNGTFKSSVDKSIKKAAEPLAAPIKNLLKKANIEGSFSDKTIETLIHACIGIGLADAVAASSALTEKIPGLKHLDKDKMEQAGRYLRGHVGDKIGSDTADGIFVVGPVLASLISNSGIGELLSAVGQEDSPVPQLTEGESFQTIDELMDPPANDAKGRPSAPNKEGKNGKNNPK